METKAIHFNIVKIITSRMKKKLEIYMNTSKVNQHSVGGSVYIGNQDKNIYNNKENTKGIYDG